MAQSAAFASLYVSLPTTAFSCHISACQTRAQAHAHTHTHTQSHTLRCTHTHTHTITHSQTHTDAHRNVNTPTSLSRLHTHLHTEITQSGTTAQVIRDMRRSHWSSPAHANGANGANGTWSSETAVPSERQTNTKKVLAGWQGSQTHTDTHTHTHTTGTTTAHPVSQ